MKKLVALALGTVMAVSMTAGVSAATVESKDDLKNATIGVQLGTTGDIEASEYEADGATVKRYSKGSEAIQALMAGQIDCVIIDSQIHADEENSYGSGSGRVWTDFRNCLNGRYSGGNRRRYSG